MVYSQKNIKKNIFERVFSKDVDSEELIWHRDKKNRIVEILEGDDWLLQMENELPKKLSVGQKIEIHKETYHRIFKGSSDLKIRITEDVDTVRVPKQVIEVVKKGLKYLKKRGGSNRLSERIVSGKVVPTVDILITTQNWSQFTETWNFVDLDKNVSPPFITTVRNPEVKYGSNPSLLILVDWTLLQCYNVGVERNIARRDTRYGIR